MNSPITVLFVYCKEAKSKIPSLKLLGANSYQLHILITEFCLHTNTGLAGIQTRCASCVNRGNNTSISTITPYLPHHCRKQPEGSCTGKRPKKKGGKGDKGLTYNIHFTLKIIPSIHLPTSPACLAHDIYGGGGGSYTCIQTLLISRQPSIYTIQGC